PRLGHGGAAGQAARAAAAGGGRADAGAARRRGPRLGHPDPQLRLVPVPERQGPADRDGDRERRRRARRRDRRVHRRRDPLAPPERPLTPESALTPEPALPAEVPYRPKCRASSRNRLSTRTAAMITCGEAPECWW